MILSDKTIKRQLELGGVVIEPFRVEHLQPASYDVRLADTFLIFDESKGTHIDPTEDVSGLMREVVADEFVLHPGQFALAATMEKIGVSSDYVAMLNGKSSLGRLGLVIHATAGFIDPGNCLCITLELFNAATLPIILRAGMKIGQIVFVELTETCERPYGHSELGSKYLGATSVQASRMHENFNNDAE